MNHVNWVQQSEEYKTEYHVVKWKSSHFHEPFARQMVGRFQIKQGPFPAASAKELQSEAEGLGLGLADRKKSGDLRPGFGQEGYPARGLTGDELGRDGVSISSRGARQQGNAESNALSAVQSARLSGIHAAEAVTVPAANAASAREAEEEQAKKENTMVSGSGRGNIRNRLKESARRLLEAYQRQKEKAAKTPLRRVKPEKPKEKTQKGTRMADREAMLSMQAENHYLLDSYDHNGNYSTLGK